MMNGKLVIGVIGQSRPSHKHLPGAVAKYSKEVGKIITKKHHIIMTGGTPENSKRVKDEAMLGAKDAGDPKHPARLLSILKGGRYDISYQDEDSSCKHLIVHTGLGDERNFITGCIPDVVIVISGGKGTSSELAVALSLNIPAVFLEISGSSEPSKIETLNDLKDVDPKEVKTILNEMRKVFPFVETEKMYDNLKMHLDKIDKDNSQTKLSASDDVRIAKSAQNAVTQAISLGKKRIKPDSNRLPPYDQFNNLYKEYERCMQSLAK